MNISVTKGVWKKYDENESGVDHSANKIKKVVIHGNWYWVTFVDDDIVALSVKEYMTLVKDGIKEMDWSLKIAEQKLKENSAE